MEVFWLFVAAVSTGVSLALFVLGVVAVLSAVAL